MLFATSLPWRCACCSHLGARVAGADHHEGAARVPLCPVLRKVRDLDLLVIQPTVDDQWGDLRRRLFRWQKEYWGRREVRAGAAS